MLTALRAAAGRDNGIDDDEDEEQRLNELRKSVRDDNARASAGPLAPTPAPLVQAIGKELRFSSNVRDSPGPSPTFTRASSSQVQTFSFRTSNVRRDGLLKRSEFSTALQTICASNNKKQIFDELTTDEIDAQFLKACGYDEDEDELTVEQFEEWLPTFLNVFLPDRITLQQLPHDPKGEAVGVKRAALTSVVKNPFAAVRALTMQCAALESLDVRTEANIPVIIRSLIVPPEDQGNPQDAGAWADLEDEDDAEAVARPKALASRLKRLDLSGLAIDDELLGMIAPHCTALRVLRLAGCLKLSENGLLAIAEGCPRLERLVLSTEVASRIEPATFARLPHGCSILRESRAICATAAPSWLLGTDDADLFDVDDDAPELTLSLLALADRASKNTERAGDADGAAELDTIDVKVDAPPASGGCCLVQ